MSDGDDAGAPQGYFPDAPADSEPAQITISADGTAADAALQMATDSIFEFLGAQWISYLPSGGDERRIKAILHFPGAEPMGPLAGGSRPHVELLVKNDSTIGIASAEVDTGGDKITAPLRRDQAARTLRIVKIIGQDKAMLRLRAW